MGRTVAVSGRARREESEADGRRRDDRLAVAVPTDPSLTVDFVTRFSPRESQQYLANADITPLGVDRCVRTAAVPASLSSFRKLIYNVLRLYVVIMAR